MTKPDRRACVEALELVDDLLRNWGENEFAGELREHSERALEYFYGADPTGQEETE